MPKPALLIIDLQEDFLPPEGALAVPNGRTIVPLINSLISTQINAWDAIIATQDWHPKDHTSFSSQHNVPPFTELEFSHPLGEMDHATGNAKIRSQVTWPDHCVQGTSGANLEPSFLGYFNSIASNVPKAIVNKGYLADREYYSCFQDVWGIHHTELDSLLKKLAVTDVVIVGLALDFCVLNSALDAAKLGYNTTILSDCTKSVYPDKQSDSEEALKNAGVILVSSTEYLQQHAIDP